jgi:hypothetical protein
MKSLEEKPGQFNNLGRRPGLRSLGVGGCAASTIRTLAHTLPLLLALALSLSAPFASSFAADAPPAKDTKSTNEPPVLLLPIPLAVVSGSSNTLILRGQHLKDAFAVGWTGLTDPGPIHILKREDAKVPDGSTAAKAGDQQLEIEFFLPSTAPAGTNAALVATGPTGTRRNEPLPILILPASQLIDEEEPNNGFKQAQPVACGQTVRGTLPDATDVDVFKITARSGHNLRFEVLASRVGSTLDAALTLYDAKGAILSYNDDQVGRDPVITYKPTLDGDLYLALTSVNEKSATTHAYLLKVSETP